MFFGVNYTDESYYFTQVIRFVSGDKPFLDTWDPLQTQGIFLIPFYYIYTLIFGYEGLLLFGRMLFFGLTLDIISYIACLYPLALLLTFRKEKIMRAKYDLLYLISILSLLQTLLISYSSGGFWYQGRYALVGVALFVVISLGEQINCLSIGNMNSKANARFRTIVVQVLIVVALILGQYIDVYGDNNYLKNLDEKITAGPGKGLYTSKQDADLANSLARDINKYAIEGGNLLALEVFPYAYGVNPSMKIFTQNTWAATLYTRSSYTDDIYKAPIFDYFEYKSDEPDMIFYYTDKKFWESSDPNYKMHQYIIENYNIACSNDKYTIFLKK